MIFNMIKGFKRKAFLIQITLLTLLRVGKRVLPEDPG